MSHTSEPLVLVVDDYQDAREMYAEYLKASGFRVAEARTGIEAVAKAREVNPDCILMDLSLPGIDGWEATRQLKADPSTRHIPVDRDHRPRVGAGLPRRQVGGVCVVRTQTGPPRRRRRRNTQSPADRVASTSVDVQRPAVPFASCASPVAARRSITITSPPKSRWKCASTARRLP